ncbi:hypothetical protein [Herpetosiphon geysericola]|uniref:Uncharacterized protein n=1 Tax=Herpetosiphon geysericola TaxID=70996 RepID=A0A0N8GTG3_9CHLR|nr:hypothetical protein [Herpetosiphon geysericola]KPL92018.1 hypothetical protein SE18_00245 [Herpetosiphon geysericola]
MRKHMLASLVVLALLAGCSTTGSAPTTAPVTNQPTNPAPAAQTPASYPTPADGNVVVEPTLEPGQYPVPNSQPTAYPTP